MKQIIISCSILMMLSACDNTKTTDVSIVNKGTYTAEGRTYTGKITTATDGLKFFMVTCEGDLVQQIAFHFKNEEAVHKGASFKPGSLTPIENNEVGIIYGIEYMSKEASGGAINATGSGGKNCDRI